jgi:hypothetical protein
VYFFFRNILILAKRLRPIIIECCGKNKCSSYYHRSNASRSPSITFKAHGKTSNKPPKKVIFLPDTVTVHGLHFTHMFLQKSKDRGTSQTALSPKQSTMAEIIWSSVIDNLATRAAESTVEGGVSETTLIATETATTGKSSDFVTIKLDSQVNFLHQS